MEPAQVMNLVSGGPTSNSVKLSWTGASSPEVYEYEIHGRMGEGATWNLLRKVWNREQTDAIVSGL